MRSISDTAQERLKTQNVDQRKIKFYHESACLALLATRKVQSDGKEGVGKEWGALIESMGERRPQRIKYMM